MDKDCSIPDAYLKKARQFRDQLLKTAGADALLYNDLHYGIACRAMHYQAIKLE